MRIAIAGKGGSGKTMLAAVMTGLVARSGRSVLAIDADSAVGLPHALGTEPGLTVADVRRRIIEDPLERRQIEDRSIVSVMREVLVTGRGHSLLVMGRPEGPGCYCSVNELLRYGIEGLSHSFDVTLVDCEAGPEQVSRRVTSTVDVLLVITDPSARGLEVARTIAQVARKDRTPRIGLVVNRARPDDDLDPQGLELLGLIPEDPKVSELDRLGNPLTTLPDDSPCLGAARGILERIL